MATDIPRRMRHQEQGSCNNHLHQEFNQKAPNLVGRVISLISKLIENGIIFA